jgi:hypothetical protein
MANRRREPVQQVAPAVAQVEPVRRLENVRQVVAPDVAPMLERGPAAGSMVRPVATGEAEMFAAQAQVLSGISARVGQIADHAAVKEGELEGKLDGMDPEFRPGRSLTLYGEAYDKAGIDTFKRNMVTHVSAQMDAAFDKHKDDPKALGGALEKVRAGWRDNLFPEVLPEFEALYNRESLGHVRQATRNHAARVTADQRAALELETQTRLKSLDQLAYRSGLDPTSDQAISGALVDLRRSLSAAGPDGRPLVNPATAQKMLIDAQEQVAFSRIIGAFTRVEGGIEAKARFVDEIQTKYQEGKDPLLNNFDVRTYERLTSHLRADLAREQTRINHANAQLKVEVDGFLERAKEGVQLTPEADAALRAKVAAAGSPKLLETYNEGRASLAIVGELNALPLRTVEAWVDAERQRQVAKGVTEGREWDRLKLAEGWLKKAHSEAENDMLGAAQKRGLPVADISLKSGQDLAQTLPARIAAADETAKHFGRTAQFFKPEERALLGSIAKAGGPQLVETAEAIVAGAGARAPVLLKEISKDAADLAIIGRLSIEKADPNAIMDLANGIALQRSEGFKAIAPAAKDARTAAIGIIGDALKGNEQAELAAIAAANSIYELRARRAGITAPAADDTWKQGLREVLGERVKDGVKYGGIVTQNGWLFGSDAIVLPTAIKQRAWRDVLQMITPEDLAETGLGTPIGSDGKPVALSRIKAGTLVQRGAAQYYVATGNAAAKGEEGWVFRDKPGTPFVLDLGRLIPRLRERRPDLFLGGR